MAVGAESILVPETKTDIKNLSKILIDSANRGKKCSIVIVAEGDESGGAFKIAEKIGKRIAGDYRVCILGHIQRGGSPTSRDRILASKLGYYAVKGLLNGKKNVIVGEKGGKIVYTPITKSGLKKKGLNKELLRITDVLAQ